MAITRWWVLGESTPVIFAISSPTATDARHGREVLHPDVPSSARHARLPHETQPVLGRPQLGSGPPSRRLLRDDRCTAGAQRGAHHAPVATGRRRRTLGK